MDNEILEGLSYNEKRLLLALDAAGGTSTPEELIGKGAFALEVEAMGSASWLSTKGLARIDEEQSVFYVLSDKKIAETGLAERRAITFIDKAGGRMAFSTGLKLGFRFLCKKPLSVQLSSCTSTAFCFSPENVFFSRGRGSFAPNTRQLKA